jgi:hypothetical protein
MHASARVLEHWGEFYLLVGTAAAALVALLFVAFSIGAGIIAPSSKTRTYMSPVVFHFASVLAGSALALMPSHSAFSLAVLIGTGALGGTAYSMFVLYRLFTDGISDLADRLCYGALPLISYAAALGAAWLLMTARAHGADLLASSVVLLLLVNIRNAWDLMLAMSRVHYNAKRSEQ